VVIAMALEVIDSAVDHEVVVTEAPRALTQITGHVFNLLAVSSEPFAV